MAKVPDNTDSLSLQLSASLSLEERSDSEGAKKNSDAGANLDTSDKKLLSTPRPRRARMRTKQMSDISSLLSCSEPSTPVPASPLTPLILAGRSPQGRHRLRKQPSDLSGMFALGPPALPLVGDMNTTEPTKEEDTISDEVPMLVPKGQNRKGRTFGLRKNTI